MGRSGERCTGSYRRYERLSEYTFDLRHPNAKYLDSATPLIERDPLLFWKCATVILACIIVALLSQHGARRCVPFPSSVASSFETPPRGSSKSDSKSEAYFQVLRASGEQPEMGDEEPGGGAGDGCLEVLGEAAASSEPREGAFDHPSARQELEAFDAGWPLDDLDGPGAAMGDSGDATGGRGRYGRRRYGAAWGSFGAGAAAAARRREGPGCWLRERARRAGSHWCR